MSQNDHPEHGARTLIERIFAFMETTALMTAAKIGLPDALADGPRSPAELAARLNVGEEALRLFEVVFGRDSLTVALIVGALGMWWLAGARRARPDPRQPRG